VEELKREDQKISLSLSMSKPVSFGLKKEIKKINPFAALAKSKPMASSISSASERKLTAMEQIMQEEEERKRRQFSQTTPAVKKLRS
jgi:hypothetical protein